MGCTEALAPFHAQRKAANRFRSGLRRRVKLRPVKLCPTLIAERHTWVESLAAAVVELAVSDYTGILHVAGAQPLSRYDFGVRLLRFHGVDLGAVVPVSARRGTPHRPLDGTLDSSRARALLRTPLPGVDKVLSKAKK